MSKSEAFWLEVHLILLYFIPQRESAEALPLGSNWFLLILINFVYITNTKISNILMKSAFFSKKTFIVRVDGRTDDWTDGRKAIKRAFKFF